MQPGRGAWWGTPHARTGHHRSPKTGVSTHLRAHEVREPLGQRLHSQLLHGNRRGAHAGAAAHLAPERLVAEEGHRQRGAARRQARRRRA